LIFLPQGGELLLQLSGGSDRLGGPGKLLQAPTCCRQGLLQFDERGGLALVGSWWRRRAGGLFGASLGFGRLLDQGRPE
jgi:hypothetical protein